MSLRERVIKSLEDRREKVLKGGINSIPSPFLRFQDDFLGIEQGKYYLLTGGTKSAKTQLGSFLFIYTTLLYAYKHPEQLRIKIFYYPLEETPEGIMLRFMSYLLYTLSGFRIIVSPDNLRSSRNDKVLSPEVLKILNSSEYVDILNFFEANVIFSSSTNPTGIFKETKEYAESHGTVHKRKIETKDEFGNPKIIETFDYYEQDDPDEYRLIFIDHVSLLSEERGLSTKQTIDKLSEYCVILRNRYNYSPVVIQQQAFSSETLEAIKANNGRPTIAGLSDSKYTVRDSNICIGIYNPFKHEIREFKGYNIEVLRDQVRFIEILVNRGGQMGGMTALYFNGATAYFSQLPLPQSSEMYSIYDKLRKKQ